MWSRRKSLGFGTAASVSVPGIARAAVGPVQTARDNARIERYVTLGRTGLTVSDISFGSASSADAGLVRHALDRGVTFFDTAESYRGGRAEEAFGQGLLGIRDKVVLSSKTRAGVRDDRTDMMAALEGSLRRLRTDYVDIYFLHAVNDVARLQNDEWLEFTEQAVRDGKIRYRGVPGHGSRLAGCLDYAIDHDLADVILAAYSFGQDPDFYDKLRHTFHFVDLQPELPRILEKAKKKDIGVIAMKTLMGARLNDMRLYERDGVTFAQAAFRWVLSSPRVDGLVISMNSRDRIDEYVTASGDPEIRAGGGGLPLLARYLYQQNTRYCRPGCNLCEGACPDKVEIAEVLRTRMYDVDYGDPQLARDDYAVLGRDAGACLTCTHKACLGACPYGVPIPDFTGDAARRFG